MRIAQVSISQNQSARSNQPNFQSRPLVIEGIFKDALTILPENMGKVHSCCSIPFNLRTFWIGILKKGKIFCEGRDDFLIFQQVKSENSEKAIELEAKLKKAVNLADTTDGEPIHLDADFNEISP